MNITRRMTSWLLAVLLALGPVMTAQAGFVGTESLAGSPHAGNDAARLQQLVDRQQVREQLLSLGISPEQVRARIAGLSDAEQARLADTIGQWDAGGDSVLGVLLLIFIVFVITDAIGATDIFPFVHPVR